MGVTFKATTIEGYCLKTLAEILQYSIKTAYYEIDSSGIHLRMEDTKKHMMFDVSLLSENFLSYELNIPKVCFGVNQLNMYTMLKSIKKKDTVTFFIDSDDRLNLGIRIEPREKTKVSVSTIKIYSAHTVSPVMPRDMAMYSYAIPSNDYSKTCKEMAKLSKHIALSLCKTGLCFETNTDNIYRKNVTFGALDESRVTCEYMSDYLANISKLSGMSQLVHMYQQTRDSPLIVRANIGTLGKIVIHIKSVEQIDRIETADEDIFEI